MVELNAILIAMMEIAMFKKVKNEAMLDLSLSYLEDVEMTTETRIALQNIKSQIDKLICVPGVKPSPEELDEIHRDTLMKSIFESHTELNYIEEPGLDKRFLPEFYLSWSWNCDHPNNLNKPCVQRCESSEWICLFCGKPEERK